MIIDSGGPAPQVYCGVYFGACLSTVKIQSGYSIVHCSVLYTVFLPKIQCIIYTATKRHRLTKIGRVGG